MRNFFSRFKSPTPTSSTLLQSQENLIRAQDEYILHLKRVIDHQEKMIELGNRMIDSRDEALKSAFDGLTVAELEQARLQLTEALGFPVEINAAGVTAWVEGVGMMPIVDVFNIPAYDDSRMTTVE